MGKETMGWGEFLGAMQAINNPSKTGTHIVNDQQMLDLASKMGILGGKDETLSGTLYHTIKPFTSVNEKGDLYEGLQNQDGSPATLEHFFKNLDGVGVVGMILTPITAFADGYSEIKNSMKNESNKYFKGLYQRLDEIAEKTPSRIDAYASRIQGMLGLYEAIQKSRNAPTATPEYIARADDALTNLQTVIENLAQNATDT